MTIIYRAWNETESGPSEDPRGSMAQHYDDVPLNTHAVPVENEVPSGYTVCGKRVKGELTEQEFGAYYTMVRCKACAMQLGQPVV